MHESRNMKEIYVYIPRLWQFDGTFSVNSKIKQSFVHIMKFNAKSP